MVVEEREEPMKDMNITFVNFETREDLVAALTTLMNDLLACPYDVAVTVVDNSQNRDGIRTVLQNQFSSIVYIDPHKNVGFGRGNTMGFQHTPARYYFALNPDTTITPNSRTIEHLIRFMDEHPRIGCIGPKLINPDGTIQESCYRFDLWSILVKPLKHMRLDQRYRWVRHHINKLLMKNFDHHDTRPVDWVLGAAMVVRHEAMKEVGWFDARFHMYFEDCDWCLNLWEHGWSVYYVHDIIITHRYARGSAQVPGVWRALLYNRLTRIHVASWLKYLWKWRHTHRYYRPQKGL